jgi:hypothetical protein
MSDHLRLAIADLELKLAEQLKTVAKTKAGINQLAELAGIPAPYADIEEVSAGAAIRPDQFYGQALHTAMRNYLEWRGKARGPATVNEIFEVLKAGGYQFETKNDDNSKRIIRITLTKNSIVFHKLPNGSYGLLAWYPNAKPKKSLGQILREDVTEDTDEQTEEGESDNSPEEKGR